MDNPSGFKPTHVKRMRPRTRRKIDDETSTKRIPTEEERIEKQDLVEHQHVVVPVPLREGLTVKISNLPFDLTATEAERLASIIRAYAMIGEE